MDNREFISGQGQMENKWLSTNEANVNTWGEKMDFGGDYRIIKISVPESELDNMYYGGGKLDGIGPAYNSECDLLNKYADTIETIK